MTSAPAGLSLMEFTAHDLPTKKWMMLIRPKMRLRVRIQDRDFVSSSSVKVGNRSSDETGLADVDNWPWNNDDERFSRPSLADNQVFEVKVERRFLLRYKCIRRTQPVIIDQVRPGDHYALSLYDGEHPAEMLGDRIEIGKITFTLRSDSDVTDEDTSSKASSMT